MKELRDLKGLTIHNVQPIRDREPHGGLRTLHDKSTCLHCKFDHPPPPNLGETRPSQSTEWIGFPYWTAAGRKDPAEDAKRPLC